jgi:hypothetical protein
MLQSITEGNVFSTVHLTPPNDDRTLLFKKNSPPHRKKGFLKKMINEHFSKTPHLAFDDDGSDESTSHK